MVKKKNIETSQAFQIALREMYIIGKNNSIFTRILLQSLSLLADFQPRDSLPILQICLSK